jgi:hypothetical protein
MVKMHFYGLPGFAEVLNLPHNTKKMGVPKVNFILYFSYFDGLVRDILSSVSW